MMKVVVGFALMILLAGQSQQQSSKEGELYRAKVIPFSFTCYMTSTVPLLELFRCVVCQVISLSCALLKLLGFCYARCPSNILSILVLLVLSCNDKEVPLRNAWGSSDLSFTRKSAQGGIPARVAIPGCFIWPSCSDLVSSQVLSGARCTLAEVLRLFGSCLDIFSSPDCELEPEPGRCRASFQRFYFNPSCQECETFTYGGCGGNANNFKTIEDCKKTCFPGNTYIIQSHATLHYVFLKSCFFMLCFLLVFLCVAWKMATLQNGSLLIIPGITISSIKPWSGVE